MSKIRGKQIQDRSIDLNKLSGHGTASFVGVSMSFDGNSNVYYDNIPSDDKEIVNREYVDNSIGDGVITVEQGSGNVVGTFSVNQSNNKTITLSNSGSGTSPWEELDLGGGDIAWKLVNNNSSVMTYSKHSIDGGDETVTQEGLSTVNFAHSSEINGDYSGIFSGYWNRALGDYSVVGGGYSNVIYSSQYSSISGGHNNIINTSSDRSFIGGGQYNSINGTHNNIIGGWGNTINGSGQYSFIGGGASNHIVSKYATVVGYNNINEDDSSLVIGQFSTYTGSPTRRAWNTSTPTTLFKAGNGSGPGSRSDAYVLYANGRSVQNGIARYGANYHSQYNDRTLVDKEYVDNRVDKGQKYLFSFDTAGVTIGSKMRFCEIRLNNAHRTVGIEIDIIPWYQYQVDYGANGVKLFIQFGTLGTFNSSTPPPNVKIQTRDIGEGSFLSSFNISYKTRWSVTGGGQWVLEVYYETLAEHHKPAFYLIKSPITYNSIAYINLAPSGTWITEIQSYARYIGSNNTLAMESITSNTTLGYTHCGRFLYVSSGATLTISSSNDGQFSIGTRIDGFVNGAGFITIAVSGAVTIHSDGDKRKCASKTGFSLVKQGANVWLLIGKLLS